MKVVNRMDAHMAREPCALQMETATLVNSRRVSAMAEA